MRIGIDIDGVLTEEKRYVIDYGSKFFYKNNIPYNINDDKFKGEEIFNVTKEQYDEFLNDYIFDYSINCPIRPFAKEIIEKLKEDGNEIYFITAHDFTYEENKYQTKMRKIVKDWLYNNEILYDDIIFSKNKKEICKEMKIDIMIEDNPENIFSISEIIPVICYANSYNNKEFNQKVYRCYSWYDIYKQINILNKSINN